MTSTPPGLLQLPRKEVHPIQAHQLTPPTQPSNHHSNCQDLWRMLLQHLLEVPARMAGGMLCHRLRGASALLPGRRTTLEDRDAER